MTYPSATTIATGTTGTLVNATEWNKFVDNVNAMIADLILARGDGQAFPGTDHTAAQSTNVDDAVQALRHQIAHVSGETNWYDAPSGSLKVHTHVVGQGGLIPWGSLGVSNARRLEIHPQYPGAVLTKSLRGASPSGNNNITILNDVDTVSYVGRHYYEGNCSQVSLQDYYIALRFTLPTDFSAWATNNAIQIEYKTGSSLAADCHVDIYIYKSGNGTIYYNLSNNVNINWSNIGIKRGKFKCYEFLVCK